MKDLQEQASSIFEIEDKEVVKRYMTLFNSPLGKEVLQHLSVLHDVGVTSYSDPPDPMDMAFKEGRKYVLYSIVEMLEGDGLQFLKELKKKRSKK